jgi:predicted nucleotidyltransferase
MGAESILVKSGRDPLAGMTRDEFEAKLVSSLSGRVMEAWLFGSYIAGFFGRESDIDLILVAETKAPFQLRAIDFLDLLDLVPRMDILVYTPEEFRSLVSDPSPGFWRSVVASMRRIL